ncbi:MAG: MFS transporter [Helicobacteraceae bacterium]|nr:MFS transporter [Helicobacteraceae bacterium]
MDNKSSRLKAVTHGFFLSITTTIAEPSIILPLIVSYFGGTALVVGILTSLIKGGAIFVQLFAAFGAQNLSYVQPHLRYVFLTRFLSWFGIGVAIYFFGENYPTLTLYLIGLGLFTFSFAAGFGTIYFNELLAKVFTNRYRAKVFAGRQMAAGVGALISGAIAGAMLEYYEPPYSYAYLFMLSSFMMALGIAAFISIPEPKKTNLSVKESSFKEFIKNAMITLKADEVLRLQIVTYLISYTYLLSMPFIILDASSKIALNGIEIGYLLTTQIVGAMFSNLLWAKLAHNSQIRLLITLAFILHIAALSVALFANTLFMYMVVFALLGSAIDGMRLAFSNNILTIAPEDKRPVYIALQSNLTSIGLFFSIPGAFILAAYSYEVLYMFTIFTLVSGLVYFRLKT